MSLYICIEWCAETIRINLRNKSPSILWTERKQAPRNVSRFYDSSATIIISNGTCNQLEHGWKMDKGETNGRPSSSWASAVAFLVFSFVLLFYLPPWFHVTEGEEYVNIKVTHMEKLHSVWKWQSCIIGPCVTNPIPSWMTKLPSGANMWLQSTGSSELDRHP